MEMHRQFQSEGLEGGDHFEDLGTDEKILKWI
jgi:hypothetical protein